MSTRYWVGVVGAMHMKTGNERGFCAFSHGKKEPVLKLSPGDRFTYYAPREGYREGDVVQAFVACGTILDGDPFEADYDGMAAWVRPARYDVIARTPIKPLLEPLEFVHNPKNWGMAVRRSLFEISHHDFDLIETTMRAV